jgi:hypothetical protein
MNKHVRIRGRPRVRSLDHTWGAKDYQQLASFMLYPDTRKEYRHQYEMVDALANALMHIDRLRIGNEERPSFCIGNRWVRLGDWKGL